MEHPEFQEYVEKHYKSYNRVLAEKTNTQGDWYDQLISALIHIKYTPDAETAILRQRDTDPEAFEAWNQYAEDAKAFAYRFVYGRNRE